MKKIVTKLLAFLLIFETIVEPFIVKKVDAQEEGGPYKGDLRCPYGHSDCTETVDPVSGEVISVTIRATKNNYTVYKYVTKKRVEIDSATYDVSFRVEDNRGTSNSGSPYVTLIVDHSGSMKKKVDSAQTVVNIFSKVLGTRVDIDSKLIVFNDNVLVYNKGEIPDLSKIKPGHSYISPAMITVANDLKNAGSRPKYVIYLIDGAYINKQNWLGGKTNTSVIDAKNYLNSVGNIEYYVIRFISDYYEGEKSNTVKFIKNFDDNEAPLYKIVKNGICNNLWDKTEKGYIMTKCYNEIVRRIIEPYYDNLRDGSNIDSWSNILNDILKEILDKNPNPNFTGTIVDNKGDYFGGGILDFNVTNIPYQSETKTITISDPKIHDLWVNTNAGFTLKDQNGNEIVSSNINPEVYWKQESNQYKSCHDKSSFSSKYTDNVGIVSDFDISENGIQSTRSEIIYNRYCRDTFNSELIINNQPLGNKKFSILRGLGVPMEVDFNETVTCYNNWDQGKYNSLYNKYSSALNNSSINEKVKAIIRDALSKLEAIKKSASGIDSVSNSLSLYANKFKEINPSLVIRYNDGQTVESNNTFSTKELKSADVSCSNNNNKCSVNLYKKFEIKENCLIINDGKIVDCDVNSNNQIYGDHKYYFDITKQSGTIAVKLLKTGYSGKIDIIMNNTGNDVCAFNTYDTIRQNTIYRQIDIKDPFIQQFTTIDKRTIGRNFSNNQYNFVNIIDADIWNKNNESEYLYLLSKTNVENIKRDTLPNDYIGISCYTNSVNKYICPFTRNIGGIDGNNNDYFTSAILKN